MAVSETGRDGPKAQVLFPGNWVLAQRVKTQVAPAGSIGDGPKVRRARTQVAPAGQVVRVIVSLGLVSWFDTTHWAGS